MAERYRRGLIPDGVYDVHLEAAKHEREMLSRQAEAAKAGIDLAATRVGETETLLGTVARLRESLEGADVATRAEIVRTLVPGRGAHVVRLGAEEIEMNVVLAAESRPPARLSTFAPG